jgi:hypothetical protein
MQAPPERIDLAVTCLHFVHGFPAKSVWNQCR